MKYGVKRKHLITKVLIVLLLSAALFFALSDCAPTPQTQQTIVTFERS